MKTTNYTRVSRFMCLILRHKPEVINLTLDVHGWAPVAGLLRGLAAHDFDLNEANLFEIVASDDKQRYSLSPDQKRIRANQGHSVSIDLELSETRPPSVLYHGTAWRLLHSIMGQGLNKAKRHHVHLSADPETARTVGARRSKPVVLAINAQAMVNQCYTFYQSHNAVWLTDYVPADYIRPLWDFDS